MRGKPQLAAGFFALVFFGARAWWLHASAGALGLMAPMTSRVTPDSVDRCPTEPSVAASEAPKVSHVQWMKSVTATLNTNTIRARERTLANPYGQQYGSQLLDNLGYAS